MHIYYVWHVLLIDATRLPECYCHVLLSCVVIVMCLPECYCHVLLSCVVIVMCLPECYLPKCYALLGITLITILLAYFFFAPVPGSSGRIMGVGLG